MDVGLLADRIGRKQVFVLTLLLFAIASGLSAFATTLPVLFVLRFFIGMGLGGELPVASTYVSERVPAHERGRIVVLLESFWAVGSILAALIAYFVIPRFDKDMGWRVALLLGAQGWSTGAIFGLFAATLMVGVLAVALLGRETRGEQAVG